MGRAVDVGSDADSEVPFELLLPRSGDQATTPKTARVELTFDAELVAGLERATHLNGSSCSEWLLAAFATVLHRYSHSDELLFVARRSEAPVLVRVALADNPSVRQLVDRVRTTWRDAEVQPEVATSFVRVSFAYHDGTAPSPAATDADLALQLHRAGHRIVGHLEYPGTRYEHDDIERLVAHLRVVLQGMVADRDQRIGALPLLSDAERHQILDEWNATKHEHSNERCIHDLFEAQVDRAPDAIAVELEGQRLTYGQLDERANQLAHHLRSLGVGPEVPVGLCLHRSLDLMVGLFAILKAGGAYIPLDPNDPRERLAFILEDAAIPIVIVHDDVADRVEHAGTRLVRIGADQATIARCPAARPSALAGPGNLAYVIYTSGSTGRPKGVQIEHRMIVNFTIGGAARMQIVPRDRVSQLMSLSFDGSLSEVFPALCSGAALVLRGDEMPTPEELCGEKFAGVTVMLFPTGYWHAIVGMRPPSHLRLVTVGGDRVVPSAVSSWLEHAPGCALLNWYGPTEATVAAVTAFLHDKPLRPGREAPIGTPLPNYQVYVLDRYGQATPIGVAGELHIAGPGVARGYVGNPELTADRFVANPFGPGRLYRTGDLVRWFPDGSLEFVGRVDQQVKVRGFRIELGEIQSALVRQEGVEDAVVIARTDAGGDKRLVAYVVGTRPATELRDALAATLPAYMIPSAFVTMEALPLTRSGKVDRDALPDDGGGSLTRSYQAPQTTVEIRLAEIWADLLKVDRIGRDDNFFELGGHSLLVMRLVTRVRSTFAIDLTVRAVFEAPTLAQLADVIGHATAEAATPLVPIPRDGHLRASFGQQRFWVLDQLAQGDAYDMSQAIHIAGLLDTAALARAVDAVVERHESLRTTLFELDGEIHQHIAPHRTGLLRIQDVESSAAAIAYCRDAVARRYDLTTGPLFEPVLLRVSGTDESVLLFRMHHAVADEWSVGILWRELWALYQGQTLKPLPVQYADVAAWQRASIAGDLLDRQLAYWRTRLADATPLELPTDHPRPAELGARGVTVERVLPHALGEAVHALGRAHGTTPFMTYLAAFYVLLHRYTQQDDVAIGTPIANRGRAETDALIGYFLNTVVLRTDLAGAPTFESLLTQVRDVALGAYAHQDVPFERVVEALHVPRSGRSPLFQVAFVHNRVETSAPSIPTLLTSDLALRGETSRFEITLFIADHPDGVACVIEANTDLYDRSTIERMVGHYQTLLEAMVADPAASIGELPLLEPDERRQLVAWNATSSEYPRDACLHEPFEAQVDRTPDAVAVVFDGSHLTYGELDRRANQLAHHLQSLGVGPDVRVGVCAERSLELVIALYGVLKAGGAYVPLDPSYPRDRLAFMVEDAAVPVLLTQAHLIDVLPAHGARVVRLDEDWAEIARESTGRLGRTARPNDLAYVIYTSGSTGRPKGAMNEHRAVVNRLHWMQTAYELDATDAVLQKTPFSFDVSVWELFWPLWVGARLVMARPEGHRDPAYLIDVIRTQQITTLHFVPSMLAVFLDAKGVETCTSLRRVVTSGEALAPAHVDRCFGRLPASKLFNLYGPTEAAIDVTHWTAHPGARIVPIGRPIANLQIHILDTRGQQVPIGVAGELYIGGVGVGRGYLNRPELTAEKFVHDPFGEGRLYRTGDLARWLADGNIEYLGRIDHQVKLRGFRIELGEIEAALVQHDAVAEAVVVVQQLASSDARLVAYVVPDVQRAGPLRRIRALERSGRLGTHRPIALPNGMSIVQLNRSETDFMYREIVADKSYLRHGVVLRDGDCVFDVGANIGMTALSLAQACRAPRIYAFEPAPPVFELLQLNCEIHGLDAKLFQCALSGENGQAEFTFYPGNSIVSGLFADQTAERKTVEAFLRNTGDQTAQSDKMIEELLDQRMTVEHYTCELKTISTIIREHQIERIDLLKIDVEKAELDVLAGIAEGDWGKIQQVVVEVHDIEGRLAIVSDLLASHGFSVTVEQDLILANTDLYNIYAVRGAQPGPVHDRVIAPDWSNADLFVAELRSLLAARLPEYMVPSAFVLLDAMPTTPNGKLDRRALPAPELDARSQHEYVAPRTDVERLLARIWCDLLGLERVGVHDDLYALGGHSLLVMRLVARVRATFAVDLTVRAVFEAPTIAQLAEVIGRAGIEAAPPLVPIPRDGHMPASFGQQRFWILAQVDARDTYDMSAIYRLRGPLDEAALARAMDQLVARQEVLRTTLAEVDGAVVQRIQHASTGVLAIVSIGSYEDALAYCEHAVQRPHDLTRGAFEPVLVRIDADDHLLLLRMHHAVGDAWSMEVLWRELEALYHGRELAPLPVQYADVAAWQRSWLVGDALDRQLTYWRERLTGAEPLDLPTDRPRPAVVGTRGALARRTLPAALGPAMEVVGRAHNTTPFMTWLGAFYVLLHRYSHQTDFSVGTTITQRERAETEGLIGYFLNTVVLRANLANNPRFADLLPQLREAALGAYAHPDVPFERVLETLRVPRDLSRSPIFQAMFVFQDAVAPSFAGLSVQPVERPHTVSSFDLTLFVEQSDNGLECSIEYNVDLFDAATIDRMLGHYQQLVESIVTDATQTIGALSILDARERKLLLEDWNATDRDHPRALCLHELVEAQVDLRPDAIAVELDGAQLTYRELEARANQLAHHLLAHGAGPDVKVGVFLLRSLDMIVALLAVLKTGSAYVPLETKAPADRLALILADAAAPLVITQDALLSLLGESTARIICVDGDALSIAREPTKRPQSAVRPEHVAYVIYTSGSTGRPKGVLVEHRNIVNLVTGASAIEEITPADRLLQFSSVAFDSSVDEIFTPLVSGATIVLRGEDVPSALELFGPRFPNVTVMNMSTAYWHAIVAGLRGRELAPPKALRLINIGGERALPESLKVWHQLLPGCALNNMYGPSETTVMATWWRLDPSQLEGREAPIGRPLPNYKVYVLDARGEPVPIGVTGELYIGGESVARGYLDRPELTDEKFLPNLFGPGRMYRTGDMVRWRADGNLDFLDRIDDQVKIRGFRVELGEIETVLSQHPAVESVAVIARPIDDGERQLVAYVVYRASVTPDDLGAYLRARLPNYMVPARLVVLEGLAVSATGKLDKAALPDVPGQSLTTRNSAPPVGAVEVAIAAIWCDLLALEEVSRHDNFFEIGGHSLLAIQLVERLGRDGYATTVRELFLHPTLAELAAAIQSGAAVDDLIRPENLERLAMARAIPPLHSNARPATNTVLVTGGTGFVGSYLLHELLHKTSYRILCPVRAESSAEATSRVRKTFEKYRVPLDGFERITGIPADLSEPRLGLSEDQFEQLAGSVDMIFHSGAMVNFVAPYPVLEPTNIGGTLEMLRLSAQGGGTPLHYVSTAGFLLGDGTHRFVGDEQLRPEQVTGNVHDGYNQTKWVAERLVARAIDAGYPAHIYRLGAIVGTNQWPLADNFYWCLFRTQARMGSFATGDFEMEVTPVEYAAEAIVALAMSPGSLEGLYSAHIYNPAGFNNNQVGAWFQSKGVPMTPVSYPEWERQFLTLAASEQTPLQGYLPLFREGSFAMSYDALEAGYELLNVETDKRLQKLGVRCMTSLELLDVYFRFIGKDPTSAE